MSRTTLTGNRRFRINWRKQLIWQVEEKFMHTSNATGYIECEWATRWRDARVEDMATLCPAIQVREEPNV